MSEIGILIIDDDEQSQSALWHILDSEGWKVSVVPLASEAMKELARGIWTLVVVNVALTDLRGPTFATLKDLALSPAFENERARVRVLFVVPGLLAAQAQPMLERERLPYVLKPIHLHDFLEKVSDLLLEAHVITQPLRQVRGDSKSLARRRKEKRGHDRSQQAMFASREDYQMTEEEIAEWEKQEREAQEQKKKKKVQTSY